MVAAERHGDSQRAVAGQYHVNLSTVQFWLARADDQRLDRVTSFSLVITYNSTTCHPEPVLRHLHPMVRHQVVPRTTSKTHHRAYVAVQGRISFSDREILRRQVRSSE
jgi:hypothetical protein